MAKYYITMGFDSGDAESGPIVHTAIDIIEANSEEDAMSKIEDYYKNDITYCGGYARLATDEEVNEYEEEMKRAEEEFQYMVKMGFIDPELCIEEE